MFILTALQRGAVIVCGRFVGHLRNVEYRLNCFGSGMIVLWVSVGVMQAEEVALGSWILQKIGSTFTAHDMKFGLLPRKRPGELCL